MQQWCTVPHKMSQKMMPAQKNAQQHNVKLSTWFWNVDMMDLTKAHTSHQHQSITKCQITILGDVMLGWLSAVISFVDFGTGAQVHQFLWRQNVKTASFFGGGLEAPTAPMMSQGDEESAEETKEADPSPLMQTMRQKWPILMAMQAIAEKYMPSHKLSATFYPWVRNGSWKSWITCSCMS